MYVRPHDVGRRPLRLKVVRRQDRVPALDGVQRLQDRVSRFAEPVAAHPLDLADSDRHAGQLGRVGVDLVPVGVVRPELGALVWIEASLEQCAEDRRIDLRPVEVGGLQQRLEVALLDRQRGVVVEPRRGQKERAAASA